MTNWDLTTEIKNYGRNIRNIRKGKGLKQEVLAAKVSMSQQAVSRYEQMDIIDDNILERFAKALGVSIEEIKNLDIDDFVNYIINNYTQNVENGGTGNQTPTKFESGSSQNIYTAEKAFEYAEKITELEKPLLYYRMQTEPDVVKKEMNSSNEK